MITLSPEMTISETVLEFPQAPEVFNDLEWDYISNGTQKLQNMCTTKNLSIDELEEKFEFLEPIYANWCCPSESASEICDHIVKVHHKRMAFMLPQIKLLIGAAVKENTTQELLKLQTLFQSFMTDMLKHMTIEEEVLFKYIKELDENPVAEFCTSAISPLRIMQFDHDDTSQYMDDFKLLTNNFTLDETAGKNYNAMIEGFQELILDLKIHMHKENNILFKKLKEKLDFL